MKSEGSCHIDTRWCTEMSRTSEVRYHDSTSVLLMISYNNIRSIPGKVMFGVTLGNFRAFSEMVEFEYRTRQSEAERMIYQGMISSISIVKNIRLLGSLSEISRKLQSAHCREVGEFRDEDTSTRGSTTKHQHPQRFYRKFMLRGHAESMS